MGKYFKTDAHIEHSINRHFQRTIEWRYWCGPGLAITIIVIITNYTIVF